MIICFYIILMRSYAYLSAISFFFTSVADVGKKSNLTSTLDSLCELSLVHSASTADSSGKDLCSFADVLSELSGIFVVNISCLFLTEHADFLSSAVVVLAELTLTLGSFVLVIHLMKPPVLFRLFVRTAGYRRLLPLQTWMQMRPPQMREHRKNRVHTVTDRIVKHLPALSLRNLPHQRQPR